MNPFGITPRSQAKPTEPFVLFLVGMQCRSLRSIFKIPKIGRQMGKLQRRLASDPKSGFLWGKQFLEPWPLTTLFLTYWRSHEDLIRFANSPEYEHLAFGKQYLKEFGNDPSVGVWHEAYEISPGQMSSLYLQMPKFGAAAISQTPTSPNRAGKKEG